MSEWINVGDGVVLDGMGDELNMGVYPIYYTDGYRWYFRLVLDVSRHSPTVGDAQRAALDALVKLTGEWHEQALKARAELEKVS